MTKQKITYLLALTLLLSTLSFSQTSSRTTIKENVNATKAGLIHFLNRTGDTIILKSNKQIFRFSVLYHTKKESILMDLGSNEAKIPLYHFEIGRYSLVAYREDAVYPISMDRIGAIAKPEGAIADLEESVLRSSLPEKELYKRNLKPISKGYNDKRVAKVAPKPDKSKALAAAKVLEAKEKKQRELAKAEANRVRKKQKDLAEAEAKEREAKEKKIRELAQVEANKARINKKVLADAKANETRKEKERLKNEREKRDAERAENSLAYTKDDKVHNEDEIEVEKVKYNISDTNKKSLLKQSREEYRKENLRPNGTKYEEAIEEENKAKK